MRIFQLKTFQRILETFDKYTASYLYLPNPKVLYILDTSQYILLCLKSSARIGNIKEGVLKDL